MHWEENGNKTRIYPLPENGEFPQQFRRHLIRRHIVLSGRCQLHIFRKHFHNTGILLLRIRRNFDESMIFQFQFDPVRFQKRIFPASGVDRVENDTALSQIKDKEYYKKYELSRKKIFLNGVTFSTEKGQIIDWQTEEVNG